MWKSKGQEVRTKQFLFPLNCLNAKNKLRDVKIRIPTKKYIGFYSKMSRGQMQLAKQTNHYPNTSIVISCPKVILCILCLMSAYLSFSSAIFFFFTSSLIPYTTFYFYPLTRMKKQAIGKMITKYKVIKKRRKFNLPLMFWKPMQNKMKLQGRVKGTIELMN